MDKFARQAGDHSYDSDAEADDEFERSVVASPLSRHDGDDEDEDDLTDRSYEDDQDSVDGGETPTTQGWNDREARSPTGNISTWTEEEVAEYITSLSPALKQYTQRCIDEGITGDALVALNHEELRELGIASVGHRLTILKAVYEQKIRSGIKFEESDYVPPSAEGEKGDMTATQDDIARIIDSIRLRDQRIIAAEAELRAMKQDLERISEENRKLREETLPVMRLVKDQRTPLPDPSSGPIPSPRGDMDISGKGAGLSRKYSTKKLLLSNPPKQPSPTHPPQSYTAQREVRDDGGTHLEASAAATAASNHLTASMQSQPSPSSIHGQLSPTSPGYSMQGPPSGSSYHPPSSATSRSFRDGGGSARYDQRSFRQDDAANQSHWSQASQASQASTVVVDQNNARQQDHIRRQAPTPSPRDEDSSKSRHKENPLEMFKSFRVSVDDPCRVVLPVALKRYNINDDWHQYALYIVHGDQERCLGLEEKPLTLFKQLDREGRKPMFMLRRHASPQEGWSGTVHHHQESTKQIPGGVL